MVGDTSRERRRVDLSVRETWKFVGMSGPSLVLKKSCLHRARLGYSPLVEVNQAINAWLFLTISTSVRRGASSAVQIVNFYQA